MVPNTFSSEEVETGRDFILSRIKKASVRNGRVKGNYLLTYQELASHLGWSIDGDGDRGRIGTFVGKINDLEEEKTGRSLLISAVVVRAKDGTPGTGFYNYVASKGIHPFPNPNPDGVDEMTYWSKVSKEVVEAYAKL